MREWYRQVGIQLLCPLAGQHLRLVIDTTNIGFRFCLLSVSLVYLKCTLPRVWRVTNLWFVDAKLCFAVHRGQKGHTTAEEQSEFLNYLRSMLLAGSQM
jgi:hypothetical protein